MTFAQHCSSSPCFSQTPRLWGALLSCCSKQGAAQLLGIHPCWTRCCLTCPLCKCLGTVQSSLVTVGWHGCTGQGGVLFNAALCQLGFTNFLVLLHDLSPRQKERKGWESVFAPEREGIWEDSWRLSRVLWQQKLAFFYWNKSVNMQHAFQDWELEYNPIWISLLFYLLFSCLGQLSKEELPLWWQSITDNFCDSLELVSFSSFVLPYRSSALRSWSLEEEACT